MILFLPQMRRLHIITHIAQANGAGLILQFAIPICGARQTIERMVGNIQLHHAFAQFGQLRGLRVDNHARFNGRGAACGRTPAAVNFDKT